MIKKSILLFALCFGLYLIGRSKGPDNPEELGQVQWLRDMKSAKEAALASEKPIFILFQEVPGCMTCKNYGNLVLSHPLIVETIESYFVPLAIFNNRRGHDAEVLHYYNEPTWNNPVVRIVQADQEDILPRLSGTYTPSGLVHYMISALTMEGHPIPQYLKLLHQELTANEGNTEQTTLSMFCFWTGEKELGKLEGVVHTEAGFMNGHEVVNVYFDPQQIELTDIIREGQSSQCADEVYVWDQDTEQEAQTVIGKNRVKPRKSFRMDREPKYYLSRTIYKYLPMSPIQAVKANALVGAGQDPSAIFSPGQLHLLRYIELNQNLKWDNQIHNPKWMESLYQLWEKTALRA